MNRKKKKQLAQMIATWIYYVKTKKIVLWLLKIVQVSEDLDDSIVTFGQQDTEKEKFEKMHYESLFEHESSSEEEMPYSYPGKTSSESTHITKHPGEKGFCKEQNIWHEGDNGKTVFGGEPSEKYQSRNLIKKESGEEEYFGSTDKPQDPNVDLSRNLFIDQDMVCETSDKYDEASETSKGDIEKNSENSSIPEQYMF